MNPQRFILITGITLSTIGAAFGYHHLAKEKPIISTATPYIPTQASLVANTPEATYITNQPTAIIKPDAQTGAIINLLDQVVADAIQRGTLDPNRLTAQQLALLPEKFRRKNNANEPELSAAEIAHIEQQIALGDDAPPEPPPQLPCPDPNHLPENFNNAYNKMIFRERGCKI